MFRKEKKKTRYHIESLQAEAGGLGLGVSLSQIPSKDSESFQGALSLFGKTHQPCCDPMNRKKRRKDKRGEREGETASLTFITSHCPASYKSWLTTRGRSHSESLLSVTRAPTHVTDSHHTQASPSGDGNYTILDFCGHPFLFSFPTEAGLNTFPGRR